MFGVEEALIRYLYEREMNRRRAEDERAIAEYEREISGVRRNPMKPERRDEGEETERTRRSAAR